MDIVALHKLIDEWAAQQPKVTVSTPPEGNEEPAITGEAEIVPERKLPEGLRAVRTKTSGDRVYLLTEDKKTRQWITNPEVLASYGFEAADVVDIEDNELLAYNMAPALYKPKTDE